MSDERFSRIERLLGPEAIHRLNRSSVMVVGLGAVGSYAVEGLARSGVGRLHLVDFDVVRVSNINRQLYALESTLGEPKVELAARRVRDINPRCDVRVSREFVHCDTVGELLGERPDVLIDAIDSLAPKVELLSAAVERKLNVLSCMGAARRTDMAALRAGNLADVEADPLAAKVRKGLRRRKLGVDIACVYSVEPPADLPEQEPEVEEEFHERGRARVPLGSLPTVTGCMGLLAAHQVVRRLLE